jgi:hypothetical protein
MSPAALFLQEHQARKTSTGALAAVQVLVSHVQPGSFAVTYRYVLATQSERCIAKQRVPLNPKLEILAPNPGTFSRSG